MGRVREGVCEKKHQPQVSLAVGTGLVRTISCDKTKGATQKKKKKTRLTTCEKTHCVSSVSVSVSLSVSVAASVSPSPARTSTVGLSVAVRVGRVGSNRANVRCPPTGTVFFLVVFC